MTGVPASGRWQRRSLVLCAVAAAFAAVILYACGLALASRPATQVLLRERLAGALRARVGEVSIGDRVEVDLLLRVSFGPLSVPAARAGSEAVVSVERVRVRPSLWGLLAGRVEPALVELHGIRVVPGPGGRDLREALARGRNGGDAGAPSPPPRGARESGVARAAISDLAIRRLTVAVPMGGGSVDFGPVDADVSVTTGAGEERLVSKLLLPGRGRIEIDARHAPDGWRARVRARDVGPEIVPPPLRSVSARVAGGSGSLDAEAEATADLSRASARVRVAFERVVLDGVWIGPQPAGPLRAVAEGTLSWERATRRVSLADASAVLLDSLRVSASGEAHLGPEAPFTLSLRADGVDAAGIIAALPPPLAPPRAAPRPAGTLDARLDVAGVLSGPSTWTTSAVLDLSRMRDSARRAPPTALRGEVLHRPEGAAKPIVVGPRNPDFVPIAELPEHVVRAVTTSEDAGFFAHQGFDFEELRNVLAEGAEAGHLMRGGSTITQQLAKNLYLSPERTLARKVREATIAIALEASLPKRRILELYLNVVEWGPGIWGIGPAARHWFGKDARALTLREAAFLAVIIPNPVRYHYMFAKGAPTESWEQRVNELLLKMTSQGALSDDQLVDALYQPIVFAGG